MPGRQSARTWLPEEVARLRKQLVQLERAAKTDPRRAKELEAAQKSYDKANAVLKHQRKARAQEIKSRALASRGSAAGLGWGMMIEGWPPPPRSVALTVSHCATRDTALPTRPGRRGDGNRA